MNILLNPLKESLEKGDEGMRDTKSKASLLHTMLSVHFVTTILYQLDQTGIICNPISE